jgi:methylthioribose-1-phosphate isomerase
VIIAPRATPVANPAFDVTPAGYVTALITEKGIIRAREKDLLEIWPREHVSKAYLV